MNSSLRGRGEFASRSSGRAKIVWCTRRVENAWLQKKEKFFDFDTLASSGFSRNSAGDQRFTILVSEQSGESRFSVLSGGKRRFCLPPRQDLRLVLLEDSGKTFSRKKRAVAGENYERPVVFWKPSKEKVIG